jgi:hypothetical protein
MSAEETTVGKYVVRLSDEERSHLLGLIHKGKHPARKLMRARVLLRADVSEKLALGLDPGVVKRGLTVRLRQVWISARTRLQESGGN